MKKIYALVLALVAMTVSFAAQAVNVTIKVDNPDAVKIQYGSYWNLTDLTPVLAENALDINEGESFYISANEGYLLLNMVDNENITCRPGGGQLIQYVTTSCEGGVWTVNTATEAEFRTSTFTLNVDHADNLRMYCSKTSYYPTIVDGTNTIAFNADEESDWVINRRDYEDCYEIKLNGEKAEGYIEVKAGDVVDVQTDYPDVDCPVHFTFVNAGTEDALKDVQINYNSVDMAPVLADNFTVKAGTTIQVELNNSKYKVNGVSANGTPMEVYGYFSYKVKEETTFSIDVEAFRSFEKTIVIEGAEYLKLYAGYYDRTPVEIKDGENKVTLSTGDNTLYIDYDKSAYKLTKLMNGEEDWLEDWSTYSTDVELPEEGVFYITCEPIVYTEQFALYLDFDPVNPESEYSLKYYFSFSNYNGDRYNKVKQGYNVIGFDSAAAGQFSLSSYEAPFCKVFLNDVECQPSYEGGTYFPFEDGLADGDVLKVYLETEPATHKLTIESDGIANFTAHRDHITEIADLTQSIDVLTGTHVKLTAAEGETILVAAGDAEATEGDAHEFTITADTKITVKTPTAIDNVTIGNANDGAVYNLQGIRVAADNLPAGVYIINGKKVYKK